MNKILGANWRTSLTGYVIAVGNVLIPLIQGSRPTWRQIAASAAIAVFGKFVKDANVTGGTVLAPNAVPDALLHQQAAQVAAVEGK